MPNFVTIPIIGRVSRAHDFISGPVWICIGRTTPWTNDSVPPPTVPDKTTIEEPVIYKRCDVVSFVIEDPNGEHTVSGIRYKEVSPTYARVNFTSTILIRAVINYDDVNDDITFRQVGIFTKLKPKSGSEMKTVLLPSEVDDPGFLEWYANQEPIYIQPNHHQVFYVILYF
ncbi:hypothetical protein [Candidatus Caldatribacterium sp.]|uniref:hypothetical protein n=1 Tax=Candidatus Caldatribacterium sp. TaxID=2282143 RepID=UPI0038496633|nr:hypothetical protein [Candidatus Caldatribacterium sp.]